MLPGFTNHAINPDFYFTDFGTAARTTSGYVVPRWKLELTGAPAVSAQPGTLPADIGQDKWLRGKSALNLTVTTLGGADTVKLVQRIEAGERFSRQPARVTTVLYGPDGAQLRYGIGVTSRIVTTRGATTAVTVTYMETIDDPAQEYLPLTLEPLTTGAFQVGLVQVDWPDNLSSPPSLELRSRQSERMLLNRYVYPLKRGLYVATGATTQYLPINFPVNMRAVPTLAYTAPSIQFQELRSGTVATIAAPSGTVLDASAGGCRFRFTGAPDVAPAATDGMLLTDFAAVLTADY